MDLLDPTLIFILSLKVCRSKIMEFNAKANEKEESKKAVQNHDEDPSEKEREQANN